MSHLPPRPDFTFIEAERPHSPRPARQPPPERYVRSHRDSDPGRSGPSRYPPNRSPLRHRSPPRVRPPSIDTYLHREEYSSRPQHPRDYDRRDREPFSRGRGAPPRGTFRRRSPQTWQARNDAWPPRNDWRGGDSRRDDRREPDRRRDFERERSYEGRSYDRDRKQNSRYSRSPRRNQDPSARRYDSPSYRRRSPSSSRSPRTRSRSRSPVNRSRAGRSTRSPTPSPRHRSRSLPEEGAVDEYSNRGGFTRPRSRSPSYRKSHESTGMDTLPDAAPSAPDAAKAEIQSPVREPSSHASPAPPASCLSVVTHTGSPPLVKEPFEHAGTPTSIATRDKGKGREEPIADANGDIRMEDIHAMSSSTLKAPEVNSHRTPPTGPRHRAMAAAAAMSHPLPPNPTQPPRTDLPRQAVPTNGQTSTVIPPVEPLKAETPPMTLAEKKRANEVAYLEARKATWRAQHEYELAAIDLRTAEQRRKVTLAQLEDARSGMLGIGIVSPSPIDASSVAEMQ